MLFLIDNKSMKVFESMQVPNHAKTQIRASRVSRPQIISYQSRTCDEITCKFVRLPNSNHETHSTRFMQSCKSNKTKIMQSQNINHGIMQRQTKQRSCNDKTSIMESCKGKQNRFHAITRHQSCNMQRETKQNSCNHSTQSMQPCISKN